MRIIIEGDRKTDFPNGRLDDPNFIEQMKQAVRRRLELRPQDTVEIKIVENLKT